MNRELLMAIDSTCNEKGLDKDDVFSALESALAVAVRRKRGHHMDIRVAMDRESGKCEIFRRWQVIDDEDPAFESPEYHILLKQAREQDAGIQCGDYIEEQQEDADFGRISIHTTKQVIFHKMREAERAQVVKRYRDRVGGLEMCVVKREDYNGVYVDLGDNAEGFIPREHTILRENFRPGDRMRAYLLKVDEEERGSQLILSRTVPEFLLELFRLEVPEVGQELINLMGAVRDPGLRAKISVRSNDLRLDPVGACVGMRGSRVQAVSNELAGERIDIILWDENPAQYVINAMSPAAVVSIVVDEDKKSMEVAVEEEKLSQAIGRGGQNIRLASKLVGWKLDVMSEHQAEEKNEEETKRLQQLFRDKLDVDEEVAAILVQEGFSSIDEIVYLPQEDLLKIEEFDQTMVDEMRTRASDALLSMAISGEIDDTEKECKDDLASLDDIDKHTIELLAEKGITTMQDLADQAVDDLLEVEGMNQERAAALIMAARAPLFEKEMRKEEEAAE